MAFEVKSRWRCSATQNPEASGLVSALLTALCGAERWSCARRVLSAGMPVAQLLRRPGALAHRRVAPSGPSAFPHALCSTLWSSIRAPKFPTLNMWLWPETETPGKTDTKRNMSYPAREDVI